MKRKILNIILAAALIFSFGAVTVSAQDEAQTGYVQLVGQTGLEKNDFIAQSKNQYTLTERKLETASENGDVLHFSAFVSIGVVQVSYRAGFDLASYLDKAVYGSLNDAAQAAAIASEVNAQATVTYEVVNDLDDSWYVAVDNLDLDDYVIMVWKTKGGMFLSTEREDDSCACGIYLNGGNPYVYSRGLHAGDRIVLQRFNVADVLISTKTLVVPNAKTDNLFRKKAVVEGTAPKGKTYDALAFHDKFDLLYTETMRSKTKKVNSLGQWSVDFGKSPIRGGDLIIISFVMNAEYRYTIFEISPYMHIDPGESDTDYYGKRKTLITLNLKRGANIFSASAMTDATGWTDSWNIPAAKIGDIIWANNITRMRIPKLSASANFTNDTITLKGPANKVLDIDVYSNFNNLYGRFKTNGAGIAVLDALALNSWDVLENEPLYFDIYYVNPFIGNEIHYRFSVIP